MSCDNIRAQLTAYLDGELEGERGSIVRGHLRGCEACRTIASDEAALRDGLRALPPVDPPASMWAGVQAKLAAAEVADSQRSAWRRWISRWAPRAPQIAFGSLVVAAAIVFLVIRANHTDEAPIVSEPTHIEPVVIKPEHHEPAPPAPAVAQAPCGTASEAGDVTDQIAAEPAQLTACYAQAAHELRELATEARTAWSDERKHELDTKLSAFDREIANAKSERAKQKSYRAQIRFLQRAVIRDDVALASTGGAP